MSAGLAQAPTSSMTSPPARAGIDVAGIVSPLAVVVVRGLDLRVAQQAPAAVFAAHAGLLVAGVVRVDRFAERAVDVDLAEVEVVHRAHHGAVVAAEEI